MSKLLRGMAAGDGADEMVAGCFGTMRVFGILWRPLGHLGVFR